MEKTLKEAKRCNIQVEYTPCRRYSRQIKNPKLSLSGSVCRSAYVAGGCVRVAVILCKHFICVTVDLFPSVLEFLNNL